jgi:hypothetical protein
MNPAFQSFTALRLGVKSFFAPWRVRVEFQIPAFPLDLGVLGVYPIDNRNQLVTILVTEWLRCARNMISLEDYQVLWGESMRSLKNYIEETEQQKENKS